jgi:outer membrane protein OmpA-like peptidoglycan-associated protein
MARPVLNFADFLIESARMINEGYSFSEAMESLNAFTQTTGMSLSSGNQKTYVKEALANIELMAKQNSVSPETVVTALGDALGSIISDSIETKNLKLYLDNCGVVSNKLKITGVTAGSVKCDAIPSTSVEAAKKNGNKVLLTDLLTSINLANAEARKSKTYAKQKKAGKPFELNVDKEGNLIDGSYDKQIFITNTSGSTKFEWKLNTFSNPVTPAQDDFSYGSDSVELNTADNGIANDVGYVNLVLYSVESIADGKTSYNVTDVVPVTIPTKAPDSEKKIEITDYNGAYFSQGKYELTETGKKAIYAAIQQNFTSIKEVTINGYASKEGTVEVNTQLCKDRAAEAAKFIKTLSKDATVTASETANIQPADNTDKKEAWRKISLDIKGTSVIPGDVKDVIKFISQDDTIYSEDYTLRQTTFQFAIEIDTEG